MLHLTLNSNTYKSIYKSHVSVQALDAAVAEIELSLLLQSA